MNETRSHRDRNSVAGPECFCVIVCERDGRWARYLRHDLATDGLPIHETRSLAACRQMLAERPASLLVVELPAAGAGDLLDLLASLGRRHPAARIVVVADDRYHGTKWDWFEFGAIWFCSSPRRLADVAQIARNHLARIPRPEWSVEQRIWSRLPWREVGS